MMRFRTEYSPHPAALRLDPRRPVVLVGSCFSDNIGARMREAMWDATVNPCGTLFNPASMARAVSLALMTDPAPELEKTLFCATDGGTDIWRSWDFPTKFFGLTREECLSRCAAACAELREALMRADALLLTFGTAWVYTLADEPGRVVANCHKLPAARFLRRRMGVEEIEEMWSATAGALRALRPDVKMILTVSPVRHLRDGFEGNSLSKATLRLACDALCADMPLTDYFPASEILTDDLRDYRFYASDLLHPSEDAERYIFGKFQERYLDESGRALLEEALSVSRMCSHRSLLEGTPADTARRAAAEARLEAFLARNPGLTPLRTSRNQ